MRLTLVVVAACLGLVSAQTPAPPTPRAAPPMFKSGVFVVGLDVSVLDKNREPVRGLTQADFTVLEDGKPQKLVAFSAVDVPDAPVAAPTAAWQRDVSPDVQTNAVAHAPEGRLFVLLLDDALMPAEAWTLKNAKAIARDIVDHLSPTDQAAVVFSNASANVQDFTTDRTKLLAAIDTLQPGFAAHLMGWDTMAPSSFAMGKGPEGLPVPMIDGDIRLRDASMRTLRDVAETLIAAPQRRKSLIFIGPGILADHSLDVPTQVGKGRTGLTLWEANHTLIGQMTDMFQRMQKANVTLYPVDPSGLGGFEQFVKLGLRNVGFTEPTLTPASHHIATVDMDFLMAAADNTGGHAIVNTNDFEPGIVQMFRENASYYVLGYDAPAKDAPGSTHRLTVKVNRPGVTVRTRSGYDTPEAPKADEKHPAPPATAKAVSGPVATGDLPMEVALAPVALPGPDESVVAVALGVRQPGVTTRTSQGFELQTSIFTPDGRARGEQHSTGQVALAPSKADARYEVLTQVALKPGRYELRFAMHLDGGDVTSSVYADIEVPDFAKLPLSLSGVMLEATPALTGGPRDAFSGVLPIVLTSKRDFAATDQVTAYWQLYEGGEAPLSPVSLRVHVVNDHDVTMFSSETTVRPEAFPSGQRSSGQRITLPLSTLAPGAYLLTVEATLGQTTTRRDVRFEVTR